MEIRASELKDGKRIPFKQVLESGIVNTYMLLWNKRMERYEIVDYANPKYVCWYTTNIFSIVKQMNSRSGRYDTAVEDSGEWANTTGGVVGWEDNNSYTYGYD